MADELTVPRTDDEEASATADDGQQGAQPAPAPQQPPAAQPARPARAPAPPVAPPPDIQGAAYVAARRDPERHAKVVDLASRLHLSPGFVDQNYDDLAKNADQATTQTEMGSVSPTLRNWLSNPDNASIAKREIQPLSQIDTGAKLLVPPAPIERAEGFTDALGTATATGMADLAVSGHLLAAAFGHQSPQEAARTIVAAKERANTLRQEAPAYATEYANAIAQHEGDLNAARSAVLAGADTTKKAGILNALANFGKAAVAGEPLDPLSSRTLGETLSLIGAHVSSFNRIKGFAYQNVEGLASMAPILAGTVAGGAVAGTPGGMAGTFIGASAVNVGSEIEQALQKHGVDLSDPAALEHALSDPVLMGQVRSTALKAGLTSAGVMTLLQGLGAKVGQMGEGETALTKLAAEAAGAATSAVGVAAGTEAGAAAKGEPVDPARAIATTLQMLGFSAAEHLVGVSRRAILPPETADAAATLSAQTEDAVRAQHDAQVLSELGKAVKDAPTTASVPERLKDLIHTATGGPDASTVYFQTADWDRYWEGRGISPVEAASAVMEDDGKAYHDAEAAGSKFAIPLSDYLTKLGPTDHFEGLLNDARTVPDGMSFAEAREHLDAVPATMKELSDEAVKQAEGEEAPLAQSAKQVREDVKAQLVAAGVQPAAADAQARLYEGMFRTLGADASVSARELFNRFGITIGRGPLEPTPEALATMEQARANAEQAKDVTPSNEAKAATELFQGMTGKGPRPRTASGRLKALSKVDAFELAREYRILTDMNARTDQKPEDVAARAKTLVQVEKEMAKRGMDPKETYMAGGPEQGPQPPEDFYVRRMLEVGKQRAAELEASGMRTPPERLVAATIKLPDGRVIESAPGRTHAEAFDAGLSAGIPASMIESGEAGFSTNLRPHITRDEASRITGNNPSAGGLDSSVFDARNELYQAARGKITFGDGTGFHIELLKDADRSTFLHETGHLFLEVLSDVAKSSKASDRLKADYQTIRDWVGAKEGEAFTVDQHEQFARGFEAYLMEGKAPSPELRSAFYRFKNWLVGIYKNLTALKVELTPEVRNVFDRILASEDEIKRAEIEGEAHTLFPDPRQAGMNEAQAIRYTKAAQEAHEAAETQLRTELMKQIRREESAEWKAQRTPIEEAVTKDVQERPVYKALSYLKDHTNPDGSALPDGSPEMKLSKAALVGAYGKDILNGVPRGTVVEQGGVHPDVAADLFGFQNGRELVDALRASPKMSDAIRTETDARMQDLYGDRMTDADVKAKADAAINGEARATLLKLEAEHLFSKDFAAAKGLTKAITRPVIPDEVLKQRASEIIGSTKMRAIRPDLFEQAVSRAGRDAVDKLLKGDIQGAADAKAKQRLARAVADEAARVKAQQDVAFAQFKKVFRPDTRLEKTRDLSFVNGARSLLASLGIGSSDKGAGDYLESVKTYAPDAYDNVQAITEDLRSLGITDYRELTADQFQELRETVQQLWEFASDAKQVVIDGDRQSLEEVLKPIVSALLDRNVQRVATRGQKHALTTVDKVEGVALSAVASLRRVESLARALDGLDVVNGPFSRVVREVLTATDAYRLHKTDVTERVAEAAKVLEGLPKQKDIAAPELKGYVFRDMNELLGAMLHTGAREGPTSNFTKLLVGRGWGTVDETGQVDSTQWDKFISRLQQSNVLTKAHYDWLQSSWDFFEELKPELQKAYYAVNRRYMKEVAHTAFETPFGEYKGGYYPAIGDTHVAGGAEIDNAMRASEDALLGTDSKFLFTQPASGMTKTRTGKTWPLVMDASQLPRHLDAVLKYVHMASPVREVFKVFNNRDFREAMGGINPAMVNDALIPFLRAASSQRAAAPATTALGKALADATSYVTHGAMQQITGANLVIMAEQLLHTSAIQSMRTADNKAMVYYHDVAAAAGKILLSPQKLTDWIHEQSPRVAARDHARLNKATTAFQDVLNPSPLRTVREHVGSAIDFVGHLANAMMDKAVWLGAYDRAKARGIEGQDAVNYADAVVVQGLGGHNPEDLSQVQRGVPLVRAMLGMYGFFNAKANQLGTDAFAQTVTDMGLKRSKSRMAAVYVMGLMAMSVSGAAARDIIGGRKRKEDETWTDTLGEWAGWGQLEAAGRMIPGGNVALQTLEMFFHKPGASADNMLSSPAANVFPNLAGTARAAGRELRGEPITSKDIKDVLGLFGTLTHLPAKVLARPIAYQMDVNAGKAQPSNVTDYVRGLLTGTGSR